MAVLATQGHKKLGLTNASDNKQLVFVKLTDSSFEALSNYIQNQAKLHSKVRLSQNLPNLKAVSWARARACLAPCKFQAVLIVYFTESISSEKWL